MVQLFSGLKLWLFPVAHVPDAIERHKTASEIRRRKARELREMLDASSMESELERRIANISALLDQESLEDGK